ncbi:MAG: nucleoside-diphosphate sugar epimerase/dehydratase [Bryobacterales bacterium]
MNTSIARSRLLQSRLWLILAGNALLIVTSFVAAFLLRFDFDIPTAERGQLLEGLLILLPLKMIVFCSFGLARGWWRYVGMADVPRLVYANLTASGMFAILAMVAFHGSFPRSILFVDFLLCLLGTMGSRLAVRLYREAVVVDMKGPVRQKLLVYGAGEAGIRLVRESRKNPAMMGEVVGFLDDDPAKVHAVIAGVPVLGRGRDATMVLSDLETLGKTPDKTVIAMPSASNRQMQEAVANCRKTGLPCQTVPGLNELLSGRFEKTQLRDISIEDLLGREAVQIEEKRVAEGLQGRIVLVTGAAGSIGSELSRQVARFRPRKLVLLDQAESALFAIENELRKAHEDLEIHPELADIRERVRLDEVFEKHGIEIVFHAAAYKHVPMMERCPLEAVRNNIFGTYNVARAAQQAGVTTFTAISSDKAVNPSSVMGATKRVMELLLATMPPTATKFVSVRFGNVLGSNGSVIPVFRQQIAARGPVTITHPEMRRFFMTIREAVQLVLVASTLGRGEEIFVLDMGDPIKVLDLAKTMIRLSGIANEDQIELRFIGMRPGEKLCEALTSEREMLEPTAHSKINVVHGPRADRSQVTRELETIRKALEVRDLEGVLDAIHRLVPEYEDPAQIAAAATAVPLPAGPEEEPAAVEEVALGAAGSR